MNRIKAYFTQRSFLLNVATLISGTAISQTILFLATPLLTRLYTPGEFGVFALYVSIVAIIGTVSTWKYELAIMLPREEEDAQALFFLSSFICFASSLLIFLLILLFRQFIIENITDKIETFIWIIPAGILFLGHFQIFHSFSVRKKYYQNISAARIVQSTAAVSTQISLRTLWFIPQGLIIGNLLGTITSVIVLGYNQLRKRTIQLRNLNYGRIRNNAETYKNFPRYQTFSSFLNALTQNLPVLLLTFFYNPEFAGFYALTQRILSAPTALIGESTRQVYYQKASEMYARGRSIWNLHVKTTLGLLKVGILPFILLGIFAPWLFSLIFGSEWVVSGKYVQLIIFWSFLLFINPPTVSNIFILGKQKLYLQYEVVLTILRFLGIYIPYLLFNNHYFSVLGYGLVGFIMNLYLILIIANSIRPRNK